MGSLSPLRAHDLGSVAIKEALKRAGVDGKEVSEVIIGQVYFYLQFLIECYHFPYEGGAY